MVTRPVFFFFLKKNIENCGYIQNGAIEFFKNHNYESEESPW